MHFDELLAPIEGDFDIDEALATWRWLVPQNVRPLLVTACGDMFLVGESGAVVFLNTIDGKVETVASSTEEWQEMLRRPDLMDLWFMPAFVSELRAAGVHLANGECYSAVHWTVLGGAFSVDNWVPTHWRAHFAALGQIHEQVKDLAPGTTITKINYTPL